MTIVAWLNLYLQVDALKDVPKVLLPQYSQEKFIQIAQVGNKTVLGDAFWSDYKHNCTLPPKAIKECFSLFRLTCYFVKE